MIGLIGRNHLVESADEFRPEPTPDMASVPSHRLPPSHFDRVKP